MSRATSSHDAVYIPYTVVKRETEKALLVVIEINDERWIPKSCIHDDSEVYEEGDEGELAVKAWWAEKEGLA